METFAIGPLLESFPMEQITIDLAIGDS